ncbi:MAG: isoprenoid biosynthesis protein ElbB [Bdellovibrionales bacterium CG10_big_fil_rev_8_21_14_0_10_45_34]|nr:MAG: isoprenoid biosynthesis protein ElbB [Bdellovibrionales bacterium CG10_big_fil_rev_8_21_14_0_10_45_34]
MKKKIAVILSGCGYLDGAEITEAISSLIVLSELGVDYQVFAPNIIFSVVDHLTGQPTGEKRNALTESARIARGKALDLEELNPDHFDAIVFPGGFGAAKNLSTFAEKGANATVLASVQKVIEAFHTQCKPIAGICISPAVIATVLGSKGVEVTIGNDRAVAEQIEKTGAEHHDCDVEDYLTDRDNKVITTPAYMYDAKPNQVFNGIRKALRELVEMA